jgi:hypothetical protein
MKCNKVIIILLSNESFLQYQVNEQYVRRFWDGCNMNIGEYLIIEPESTGKYRYSSSNNIGHLVCLGTSVKHYLNKLSK